MKDISNEFTKNAQVYSCIWSVWKMEQKSHKMAPDSILIKAVKMIGTHEMFSELIFFKPVAMIVKGKRVFLIKRDAHVIVVLQIVEVDFWLQSSIWGTAWHVTGRVISWQNSISVLFWIFQPGGTVLFQTLTSVQRCLLFLYQDASPLFEEQAEPFQFPPTFS